MHDSHVTAWMVAHRIEWLTSVLRVITWLGSAAVIVPLGVIVGGFFVLRRRRWQPLALLAAAVAGAVGLYDIVKPLIGRPRPPPSIWIGQTGGHDRWVRRPGAATEHGACQDASREAGT